MSDCCLCAVLYCCLCAVLCWHAISHLIRGADAICRYEQAVFSLYTRQQGLFCHVDDRFRESSPVLPSPNPLSKDEPITFFLRSVFMYVCIQHVRSSASPSLLCAICVFARRWRYPKPYTPFVVRKPGSITLDSDLDLSVGDSEPEAQPSPVAAVATRDTTDGSSTDEQHSGAEPPLESADDIFSILDESTIATLPTRLVPDRQSSDPNKVKRTLPALARLRDGGLGRPQARHQPIQINAPSESTRPSSTTWVTMPSPALPRPVAKKRLVENPFTFRKLSDDELVKYVLVLHHRVSSL